MPTPDGAPGFVALRRGDAELGVTIEEAPRMLAGVEPGAGPRHELFVYVDDVDATVERLRAEGIRVLREAAEMPWGERVAYVADPDGNVVSLATPTAAA